ncbi:hypothetical protein DPMN_050120 [Dreissena polymorpha]|uniref:Reverse transcriptase domain-containing protein n=1 Tax=Dreissena polymorpha TaxID=45954 RepID=A0A9D4CGJ3_DREPO|nr:hypothetical protein DPMN_050120 [Dreissena polymorpha]
MYLLKPTFKLDTPSFIQNSIKPLHWGVSLDLEDAYFHVPIHPNFRKYSENSLLRPLVGLFKSGLNREDFSKVVLIARWS